MFSIIIHGRKANENHLENSSVNAVEWIVAVPTRTCEWRKKITTKQTEIEL